MKYYLVLIIAVMLSLPFPLRGQAQPVISGSCYGISNGHAVIQNVQNEGLLRVFSVTFNGSTDWIRTTRFPRNGTRITFNGAYCYNTLDVFSWWYGTTGKTEIGTK